MTFSPRLPPDILTQLLARVIASNEAGITDVSEGGVLSTILGSVAQEFSNMDLRIYALSQSFFLQLEGADLDRRIEEFPSSFARRLTAAAASGGNFTLTRDSIPATLVNAHVVPARTLIVQASSNPTVKYTNVASIVFEAGQNITEGHTFVALNPGTIGNISSPLAVDTILSGYAQVIACTNVDPITGGLDREPDQVLRVRAQRWIASLALCQNNALEVLALSYRDSNNSGLTHARMWNDPDMRGYSELVVDNGSGMVGFTTTVPERTITLPNLQGDGNRYLLYFQGPAVVSPTFYVLRDSVRVEIPAADIHVLHEQGLAWIRPQPSVPVYPGDEIVIGAYPVFTSLISEIQDIINNTAVAAGTRVRIVPPVRQIVTFAGDMTVATGTDIRVMRERVAAAIQEYLRGLAPGEPLFIYRLIGYLNLIPGVINIVFDQTDVYPGSIRHKLVTTAENVRMR
jgi:hypothetical protein